MNKFNEKDARKFYHWLSHRPDEYTEIRIIVWPPPGPVIQRWVQNEDDFIKLCREWSGRRQVYAGLNPRKREGGKEEDVSRVVGIPFDIDSKRPTKDDAATEEELAASKERMIELNSWMRTRRYKAPFIAMSGNGFHLIQRVDIPIDEDLPDKLEAYFHEAPTEGMDRIFDIPRIIKVVGTMSVKGVPTKDRPHRLSYILTEGDPEPDKGLAEHIKILEPYTPVAKTFVPTPTTTTEAIRKRRTGSLRPCFKRFAEEGGKLASIGSDDNLLRLALVVEAHAKGYSRAQILELFAKADDFDPKITRDKVDRQLGKIAVEGLKVWSCRAIHKRGGCLGETCNRYVRHVAKYLPTPAPDPGQPAPPDAFFDGQNNFIPSYLVDYIIQNTGEDCLLTPTTKKGGDITWRYHTHLGIFRDDGIPYIEKEAKHILGDKAKTHMIAEVVRLAQIGTYIDREQFEEDPDILVLQNGVYHLDTGELTEHDPQYKAKSRWSIIYDPSAKAPAILKFLEEVIPGKITLFLEWLGYHFFKDYRWAEILMLIGDGENGKSILLRLMRAFLGGSKNVADLDLLRLVTNRFAASRLYGKIANIAADVGAEELKYTGRLKTLTGNDWMEVEAKHQEGFSILNYAKLSFSTNRMPKTPDPSRAFHRRWLVISCPNFFVKDANPDTLKDGFYICDPDIITKITTPQELSGLFNLALEGRTRLLEQGGFSDHKTADEKQELYEELMDSVTAFLKNCVNTMDPDGVIIKDIFHRLYYQFCKMKGYTPVLMGTLTTKIKPLIPNIMEGRRRIREKRETCWVGISMTPDLKRQGCQGCQGYITCVSTVKKYDNSKTNKRDLDASDTLDAKIEKKPEKGLSPVSADAEVEDTPSVHERSLTQERTSSMIQELVSIVKAQGHVPPDWPMLFLERYQIPHDKAVNIVKGLKEVDKLVERSDGSWGVPG